MFASKLASFGNVLEEIFSFEEDLRKPFTEEKEERTDDMVLVSEVCSTDVDDMVLVFNEDDPANPKEAANRIGKVRSPAPIAQTKDTPLTANEVLRSIGDASSAFDDSSTNDDNEKSAEILYASA